MAISKERRAMIRAEVKDKGVDATAELLGISRESVRRECRHRASVGEVTKPKDQLVKENSILAKILERYSDKELRLIANGGIPLAQTHAAVHKFKGEKVKIGYFGDTHIGSIYTDDSYIAEACATFKKAKVDIIVHVGDVTEGMSNRPGHIYECTHLGYNAQKLHAIEVLKPFSFAPLYMIDGNHDRWYIKSAGAHIVKDICDELPNATFLGHDEGDIIINGVRIKLWHGEDSGSYAISYRLQKLIESFSGGEKPHILYAGHTHKEGKFQIRNVHCVTCGSIQKQSKWMRGKRLAAHTGFGISDITTNEGGVGTFSDTFYPFYA